MQKDDPRSLLIIQVVRAIKELQPEYAIIENVIGMPKAEINVDGELIVIAEYIKRELKAYFINSQNVDFADYGIPQHRKRNITLLSKSQKWEFPIKEKHVTVKEAIDHLPSLESCEKSDIKWHVAKKHNDDHILWLKHTPTGKTAFDNIVHYPKKDGRKIKGFSTTYKRMDADKPAPTITMANGSISSQNNVHYGRLKQDGTYSDARVLTIRELLILTTLPEDWNIPDWATDNLIREVIGEAVPPLFFKKVLAKLIN